MQLKLQTGSFIQKTAAKKRSYLPDSNDIWWAHPKGTAQPSPKKDGNQYRDWAWNPFHSSIVTNLTQRWHILRAAPVRNHGQRSESSCRWCWPCKGVAINLKRLCHPVSDVAMSYSINVTYIYIKHIYFYCARNCCVSVFLSIYLSIYLSFYLAISLS